MRLTRVTLEITNPENPKKSLQDEFLVDSGAVYTVLPKKMVATLRSIKKLKAIAKR